MRVYSYRYQRRNAARNCLYATLLNCVCSEDIGKIPTESSALSKLNATNHIQF